MENTNETIQQASTIQNSVDSGTSPVTDMLMDEMVNDIQNDAYDYNMSRGRNHEYYPDPTYHKMARGYYNAPRPNAQYDRRSDGITDETRDGYRGRGHGATPYYVSHKSRRYETIGLILRIVDLAGFELAERVVLRDKETGETYR